MQSKRINLPFPRNPDYGRGATRRRVRLVNAAGVTTGHLVDIFHAMDCRIEHDGANMFAIGPCIMLCDAGSKGAAPHVDPVEAQGAAHAFDVLHDFAG